MSIENFHAVVGQYYSGAEMGMLIGPDLTFIPEGLFKKARSSVHHRHEISRNINAEFKKKFPLFACR
jgi:hypothetical protein